MKKKKKIIKIFLLQSEKEQSHSAFPCGPVPLLLTENCSFSLFNSLPLYPPTLKNPQIKLQEFIILLVGVVMLDPANDLLPPPSSPTISSVSSSDLDTESTGSFFHDRSTTLGTLMGVTFPAIATFRTPSRSHSQHRQFQPTTTNGPSAVNNRRNKKSKKNRATVVAADEEERRRRRRRRWWRLCRDDGNCRPASLGEFLEVERRFGDGAFFSGAAAELEGVPPVVDHPRNGRLLFADGRVLPPAEDDDAESSAAAAGGLCRFSVVSLTSICSGGGVG